MDKVEVIKFLYINMGIDKWSMTDCDYTEEIKKYLIGNYEIKKSVECPTAEKFWGNTVNFNNDYYSCNPIAFYPYLTAMANNITKYFNNNQIDFLITGELCKYDLLDNLYSTNYKKIICQEYITNKQENDNKIEKLYSKFLKDFNLNKNNVKSLESLKNNYHKLFATISNKYEIDNAYNIYTCGIDTHPTNIRGNIEYYSLIKPKNLEQWCNDYFNFHSQLHIIDATIKDKTITIINVHNRKFASNNTDIFYRYFIELIEFFGTYKKNVIIIGDFNFNVDTQKNKLFMEFSENLKTKGYISHILDDIYALHKTCSQNKKTVSLGLFTNIQDFIITTVSTPDCSLDLETSSHLPIIFNMIENNNNNINLYIKSIQYIMERYYTKIFSIITTVKNSPIHDTMNKKIQDCINLKDSKVKDINLKFNNIKYTIIEVTNFLNARLISIIKFASRDDFVEFGKILIEKLKKYLGNVYYLDKQERNKLDKLINLAECYTIKNT